MLTIIADVLAAATYTPTGGVADPYHPVYALIWVLNNLAA